MIQSLRASADLRRRALVLVLLIAVFQLQSGSVAADISTGSYYEKRKDWSSLGGGELNISSYIFRDLNRNGLFDVGDRPMAGIAVEMRDPVGRGVLRRSNIHGFSNFLMSVLNREADIRDPGDHVFTIHVPSGWSSTTHNEVQTGKFELFPGSYADIVLVQPLTPVGLSPLLTITGAVDLDSVGSPDSVQLRVTSPSGRKIAPPLRQDGEYSLNVHPGEWIIEASTGAQSEPARRAVTVRDAPVFMSSIRFGSERFKPAKGTTTVTFDNVTEAGIAEIPSGLGGVLWHNMVAAEHTFYPGSGYVNVVRSGTYVSYNSSGHPASVSQAVPFDFVGGYFGVAWSDAEGEILTVRAWRGETMVYEEEVELSSLGPVWFDADYRSVTRIEFATAHYWQLVADDLVFRVNAP